MCIGNAIRKSRRPLVGLIIASSVSRATPRLFPLIPNCWARGHSMGSRRGHHRIAQILHSMLVVYSVQASSKVEAIRRQRWFPVVVLSTARWSLGGKVGPALAFLEGMLGWIWSVLPSIKHAIIYPVCASGCVLMARDCNRQTVKLIELLIATRRGLLVADKYHLIHSFQ